jgi:PhnB protein
MTIRSASPYLQLDGKTEAAIALYTSALGAKTETLLRFGDLPASGLTGERGQRVLHAVIRIGDAVIMASDGPRDANLPSGNVAIALDFDDPADMAQKFEALATGGKIDFPLHDTFYGGKLGGLTDSFGVRWMFNHGGADPNKPR